MSLNYCSASFAEDRTFGPVVGSQIKFCGQLAVRWYMSRRTGHIAQFCNCHAKEYGDDDPIWLPLSSQDEAIVAEVMNS